MTTPSENGALGILWIRRLDKSLLDGPEPHIAATFSRANPEMADELAQAMGFDDAALVLQRFHDGKQCYIARVEGKLVAYGWITFDKESIGELGLSLRLQHGEAYIWNCATLPEYRGQRLYPALLAYMLVELQKAGIQRIWIGTDADNLPSQSGVTRVGCQPIAEVFQAHDGRLSTRGRPGVPPEDVLDAHYAMFGNRDVTRVVLPEKG